jgi:hypothetical protein
MEDVMFTPHQSQFTVFGGAFVSEQHEVDDVVRNARKPKFAWLSWVAASIALVAAIALITTLAHHSSLTIEPITGDSFIIADPFRM